MHKSRDMTVRSKSAGPCSPQLSGVCPWQNCGSVDLDGMTEACLDDTVRVNIDIGGLLQLKRDTSYEDTRVLSLEFPPIASQLNSLLAQLVPWLEVTSCEIGPFARRSRGRSS